MSSTNSVTVWIGQLKSGEETALAKLHERYRPFLEGLARKRLKGTPTRAADEEDIAQQAFWSFYRGLKAGRIPQLENRGDLLALLTHIVACKVINQIEHEFGTQKRQAGRNQGDSVLNDLAEETDQSPLEQALLHDCYSSYLTALPDKLRDFAELYLAGFTHKEIAGQLGCVERTVERKIALVFERWRQLAAASVN
jgi:RNA polymerase sigma factor (sigma-70 family)